MRILLDTHALLWWLDGDGRLSKRARAAIGDVRTTCLVSAASAWEITTKARLGKLPGALAVAADVSACLRSQQFTPLDISVDHAQRAGSLPGAHRDPFDRMLIAQAHAENLPVVSNDEVFDGFGVVRIW
ncbi:MAG: type II toxin-antitoxin system VapC family toxin [Gemmatimonadetes bacterium]|nr:type II toxin-antitoxin system VapC family toxin [Gemmatimonadota bacterium]